MSLWLMPELSVSSAMPMYCGILMIDKSLWKTCKTIAYALETLKFEDLNRMWEDIRAEQRAENEERPA